MRKFAISDIHGCVQTFKALLGKINYTKNDELYLLGDYIDRGPDGKGVIDHIWHLQQEGYAVHCLLGNHEKILLDAATKGKSFYDEGEIYTLFSFGVNHYKDIPTKYIDWIKGLVYYLEIDNYILVHAGLNFKVRKPFKDLKEMIWIRRYNMKIDKDWLGDRIVIHGHTPITLAEMKKDFSNLAQRQALDIDGGCCFNDRGLGHLVAFELGSQDLFFQPLIDTWPEKLTETILSPGELFKSLFKKIQRS